MIGKQRRAPGIIICRILVPFACSFSCGVLSAQTQTLLHQFGSSGIDSTDAIAPNLSGGIFAAGRTAGDLGATNAGGADVWVASFDADGLQLWLTQLGTNENDIASVILPDGVGGVFAAGKTQGDLGGPAVGLDDVWVAHVDDQGNLLWLQHLGSIESDGITTLISDGVDGVIVAGIASGSLNGSSFGGIDAWIARFDGAGIRLWLEQFGTNSNDFANAIVTDGKGGAFITGDTRGDLGSTNAGKEDAWLAHFNSQGLMSWIRQFGTEQDDLARGLIPDGVGGAIVSGRTGGDLAGPSAGEDDVWLARYDSAGNRAWIRQVGTPKDENSGDLFSDGKGSVFISGSTYGDLGGPNRGLGDAWAARFDLSGNQIWLEQIGSAQLDFAGHLAPDGADGIFVSGYTFGALGGVHAGAFDVWIARFDSEGVEIMVDQFGSAQSDVVNGIAFNPQGGVFIGGWTDGSLGGTSAGGRDAWIVRYADDGCYADCDQSTGKGVLDVFDFLCFQNSFVSAQPYACECDTSTGIGVCDVFDFLCFQNAFVGGCK